MTAMDLSWPARAARLAETLTELGKLTDPMWRAAVCAVPRHAFVSRYFTQDHAGAWTAFEIGTDDGGTEWLDNVYSNTALITALRQDTSPPRVLSSSSQPGLMTRMLEALDIHPNNRVLEIGTGTGYNAALLTHRLGSDRVFSVDIEPELVDLARKRLAALGYTPTLNATDGALGLPEYAPFDRIIATCAVSAVPWTWVEQLSSGGVILTDLKIAHGAGSLVRISRTDTNRAQGWFDPTYAAFMSMRHHSEGAVSREARDTTVAERWASTVDPQTPWSRPVVWFLASFELGPDVSVGYAGVGNTPSPISTSLSTPDGAWAEIALDSAHGLHQVTEGGPRHLWRIVERAHQLWLDLDRPGWNRFGLTVTPQAQTVFVDSPDGESRWSLEI